MKIKEQDGMFILTHGAHSIIFSIHELQAMRGLGTADLRTWLRTNKYPQYKPKQQQPLTEIVKNIDQLPRAIEVFFLEKDNPDNSVTVEPAG